MNEILPGGDETLAAAIAAARLGDHRRARSLLVQILERDRKNASAWLWLSTVVEELEHVEICLENVLSLEPGNRLVAERLAWLEKQIQEPAPPSAEFIPKADPALFDDSPLQAAQGAPGSSHPPSEAPFSMLEKMVISDPGNEAARREWLIRTGKARPAAAPRPGALPSKGIDAPESLVIRRQFSCPKCGGNMRFNSTNRGLQCLHCGHREEVDGGRAQLEEASLDVALADGLGYRWSGFERVLRCKGCGASTIFPPAWISVTCPFCEGAVFGTTPTEAGLVAPRALIPMQIDAEAAQQRVKDWLGSGFFTPAELVRAGAEKAAPMYIPLWLISAVLRFQDPSGPSLLETLEVIFIDRVEPGIDRIPSGQFRSLEPFDWKDLVEFKPEYLARWPAVHYEISVNAASQKAQAKMMQEARSQVPRRIVDPGVFYGQSYKLVLFPLWITTFKYRKKNRLVIVNGQSGKVAGEKPLDWVRIGLAAALAFLILGPIAAGLLAAAGGLVRDFGTVVLPVFARIGPIGVILYPVIALLFVMLILIMRKEGGFSSRPAGVPMNAWHRRTTPGGIWRCTPGSYRACLPCSHAAFSLEDSGGPAVPSGVFV